MMSEMVSDMGAVPVQVVYSQVYAALHNGRIDGAENNWPSYEAMGHYEVAPYFLKNEHTRVPEIQIASRAALEKLAGLDSSFPGIVRGCARDSANVERRLWAEREAQAEEDMRAWGVEVTTLSEDEMQKFRAAVRPMYERVCRTGRAHPANTGSVTLPVPRCQKAPSQRELFDCWDPCDCALCLTERQELGHVVQKKFSHSLEKQDIFQKPLFQLRKFAKV